MYVAQRHLLYKMRPFRTLPSIQRNVRSFRAISYSFHSSVASPHQLSANGSSHSRPEISKQGTQGSQQSNLTTQAKPHTIDPRWLTAIKRRVGKCLMFGLKPAQVDEAGRILQRLAQDWRELVAGSEGFLTNATRRALYRRDVVWGDMVIFVPQFPFRLNAQCRLTSTCLISRRL